jgi:hypothetical protein
MLSHTQLPSNASKSILPRLLFNGDTPAAVQAGYWYYQGDLAVEK